MNFLDEAKELEHELINWRRDFHRHPELGFKELRTSHVVTQQLNSFGFEVKTGIAQTGIVGILNTNKPGPTIMVRIDMDALPIHEMNETNYKSENPGVMHACGHDGHMAIGLGTAKILSRLRSSISGRVMFVFQPAEEGLGGAKQMIDEGILKNPKPDSVLGFHLINELPFGILVVHSGPLATSHDKFSCIISGKGGHGAIPHLTRDPIVALGYIITAIQTIVSRNISPLETGVVSITTVSAEGASNIIPESVEISGTIRAFNEKIRSTLHNRTRDIIEGVSRIMGCHAELTIETINPAIYNNPEVTSIVFKAAETIVGLNNINTTYRSSGSDDIAFFTERIPGCVFHIGSANEAKGLNYPGHNPFYDFDEHAMVLGVAVLLEAIVRMC
jgi:amidohydrolase